MEFFCQLSQGKLLLCEMVLDVPQNLFLGGVFFFHKDFLGQLLLRICSSTF